MQDTEVRYTELIIEKYDYVHFNLYEAEPIRLI